MKIDRVKIVAIIVLAFSLSSCKKQRETTTSEDFFMSESISNDLDRTGGGGITMSGTEKSWRVGLINEGGRLGSNQPEYQLLSHCIKVTVDTTQDTYFPVRYTIDWGTSNCQGHDGKYRRGKVIVELTGKYRSQGTQIKITPNGYYVDDKLIEGQLTNGAAKIITNKGTNTNGNIYFEIQEKIKITHPDGKIATWESTRTREWIAGSSTLDIWDDEYLITGNGNGVNRNGISYTVSITKPIHIKLNCFWPVEGTIEIVPSGYKKRTLDFGNGACDNEATMTVANKTIIIKM